MISRTFKTWIQQSSPFNSKTRYLPERVSAGVDEARSLAAMVLCTVVSLRKCVDGSGVPSSMHIGHLRERRSERYVGCARGKFGSVCSEEWGVVGGKPVWCWDE